MTREQAMQILALYRGNSSDASDPEFREALELARRDPELKAWLDQRLEMHAAISRKMRSLKPPAALKQRILLNSPDRKVVPMPQPLWRRPALAIAAAILLLATLAILVQWKSPDSRAFAQFESRMIGTALRQYRMDLLSEDMGKIRQFMADKGAPADYKVPRGLDRLKLTGGGALKWNSNPVAMVCFDRGDRQMLYLFVTQASAVEAAGKKPQLRKVSDLLAASWTEGGKTYLLAGPAEPGFIEKYIQ